MSNLVPINDIERMATAVAKSGLFGIKSPEQGVALMLIAQAEGLHPAIAARDYHVIQGRPALKADAMLARFQAAGGKVNWDHYDDYRVTGTFTHPAGGSVTITWTLEQAQKIGLAGKENWAKYPRAMLRARVISEGIRTVYPGCVVGVYTPEEVGDFTPPPAPVKDMGKAEIVDPEPPVDGVPLMMPGQEEPFDYYANQEEWVKGFGQLVAKIQNSTKLSDEDKQAKIDLLGQANVDLIQSMTGILKGKLKATIVAAGGTVSPKSELSLSHQESAPSGEPF